MTDIRYVSTKEAAEIMGLSTRRVVGLCNTGKREGALRKGRNWKVPEEAVYAYIGTEKPKAGNGEILSCAVGNTSYIDVVKNSYYLDKTLLIRDEFMRHEEILSWLRGTVDGDVMAGKNVEIAKG